MKTKLTFLLALTFLFLFSGSSVVVADDLQDGWDAYDKQDYKTAHRLWLPLAEQGNAEAQNKLGGMYLEGKGVPQDYKEAVKWYRLAAEQGNAQAQVNLGEMYYDGLGVPKDYKEAFKWTKLAAEQGHPYAQHNLEGMYQQGQGVPQDDQDGSFDLFDGMDAMEKGNYKTAHRIFLKLAKKGDAGVQFFLTLMYLKGEGVPQDYKEAAKWCRLAAEQGFPDAQLILGVMYRDGQGVPQDYKEAVKWYRLAAEQGNAKAQSNLGEMYHQGQGVPQDYKEAAKWFRLAANQGIARAQHNLGVMYRDGEGVPQDYKEAAKWYRLAAEQGNASAQKALKTVEDTIEKQRLEEEAKKKEQEKIAAEKAEFNKLMESAEKYRPVAKEFCEKDEDVSKCTTLNSCVIASLIKKLKHDDRVKKFKKTVEGSLFSKGSPKKASDELRKSLEEDELFLNQVMKISTRCLF
jgi:uncharacterized protein